MPRPRSDAVRLRLVERAAAMLAAREPVTARSLVTGTNVSTMAVYTYFGGMPGLWRAVRQEGFARLAAHVGAMRPSADPVRDLAALGAAYHRSAQANPNLYRAMFDDVAELDDPAAAATTFTVLVATATRAVAAGRLRPRTDPEALATRFWAAGHGIASLAIGGVLPADAVAAHGRASAVALLVEAGDDPTRCRRSVARGWR